MKRAPWYLAALAAAWLSVPARGADAPSVVWADFRTAPAGRARPPVNLLQISEKPGDVAADPLGVHDGGVRVSGRLSRAHGSTWSTLGVDVGAARGGAAIDLSAFRNLRIRLVSPTEQVLRIRIKGTDTRLQNTGCYPVLLQKVRGTMDIDIPLAVFEPEPYCAGNGASIAQTLPAVASVEVTANEPSDEPVRFEVGRIEFSNAASEAAAVPRETRDAAWRLAWADEFDAAATGRVDEKRWRVHKAPGGAGPQLDGAGHLLLPPASSLRVRPTGAMVYGRIELRAKLPAGSARVSLQGAPLASLDWLEAGEIALVEKEGADLGLGLNAPGIGDEPAFHASVALTPSDDGFHRFSLEWDPVKIRWAVDDVAVKAVLRADVPAGARDVFEQWPFLLNLEVGPGAEPMLVDQVRIYQKDELAAVSRARVAAWKTAYDSLNVAAPVARPVAKPTAPRAAAEPAARTRVVTCERNKFGLMMCY
ncbi:MULTISPECIES: family 16 glycosylhydrolase [unclassified Rhizobacter]|uniref:glycoside hydrolase family 16 protein n=1 Tax=unclassified Rhizobacter TaxID=2640088 RepID=UPI0007019E8E|nr:MULTISPECIES: family 16 glycosylhydrolase [unclassified Rhizobacter]KQU75542.1 hypothetical protein ASC88_24540 [Rhizobacter sp. Root29]KQW06882.1 hypothetical protein ASC98_25925 [Rhizobacter sp. Root1238]KRB18998.1 hypothetical protein ASE08_07280 [Rhizobacter sp. Root16D2]